MNRAAGSFDADSYKNRAGEANRLKVQAGMLPSPPIWKKAGLRPGMDVLDLGCGPASVTCDLAREVHPGRVTGFDLSQYLLEQARAGAAAEKVENVRFVLGDAAGLELDLPVDFAWSRLVFQHLPQPAQAMSAVFRALKPGGTACIVDADRGTYAMAPEPAGFRELIDMLIAKQARFGGDALVGRKLGTLMVEAGFVDVKLEFVGTVYHGEELPTVIDDIWIPALTNNPFLPEDEPRAQQSLATLSEMGRRPDAFLTWGWFIATGRRP